MEGALARGRKFGRRFREVRKSGSATELLASDGPEVVVQESFDDDGKSDENRACGRWTLLLLWLCARPQTAHSLRRAPAPSLQG